MTVVRKQAGALSAALLVVAVAAGAEAQNAREGRRLPWAGNLAAAADLSAAYSEHPLVSQVRGVGYLTLLDRERVLSERLPTDRALAAVDACGPSGVAANDVAKALAVAVHARVSIGPSGALLRRQVPLTELRARHALVLGWARLLAASKPGDLLVRGKDFRDAGAVQLLTHAASLAPDQQAAGLALALAQATAGPRKGKVACRNFQAVQRAARAPGKESVRLDAADRAAAAVATLGESCSKREIEAFAAPIQLPPPLPEPTEDPGEASGRGSRPASDGDVGLGQAFVLAAPFFKGYLDDPTVRLVATGQRLDEVTLAELLARDRTGDLALAATNASVLVRSLSPPLVFVEVRNAVLRRHGLLDAPADKVATLRLSALRPPEAVSLAYSRAVWPTNPARVDLPGDPPALEASPRQLFEQARRLAPADAALGPVIAMGWLVDVERAVEACRPRERAESLAFVIRKGTLPAAAREPLLQALDGIVARCPAGGRPGGAGR
jgi:hypothetical protein